MKFALPVASTLEDGRLVRRSLEYFFLVHGLRFEGLTQEKGLEFLGF